MKLKFSDKIKTFVLFAIKPINWIRMIRQFIVSIPHYAKVIFSFITFFIVLIHFSLIRVHNVFCAIPLIGHACRLIGGSIGKVIGKPANMVIQKLESMRPFQVRQSYLIFLAYENLKVRKSRTLITVLGMATGVGIIVYLLSLGYGIERLVISQVASLNELRIVDVSSSRNTALRIDNTTIKKISRNSLIEKIVPLVSLVGKVNFRKAVTDTLVYGATQEYLSIAQVKLIKGKGFSQSAQKTQIDQFEEDGVVAGAETVLPKGRYGKPITKNIIRFNILPNTVAPVRESCDISSKIIGYTVRVEGDFSGQDRWGSAYTPYSQYGKEGYDDMRDDYLGHWVYAKVPLFNQDLDENLIPKIAESGYQEWEYGCVQRKFVQHLGVQQQFGAVLGDTTATVSASTRTATATGAAALDAAALLASQGVAATGSAQAAYQAEVISTDSAGIEFVRLTTASESGNIQKLPEFLSFSTKPSGEAIISTGFMKLLGLPLEKIIGAEFEISLMLVKALRPDIEGRKLSEQVKYKVVGVVENDNEQFIFIPFSDLQKIGVKNYSQLKVVMKNKNDVPKIRTQIETFGYTTTSSADTVEQIEALFRNLRLILASIGLIALAVASLGMFNTLTVSLLERTREIGGMKVIGMVSDEIQDLFLAEAMIMGFAGGIGGITFGFILGQLSSFAISIFSVAQGLGYLQVSYIPFTFVLFILMVSFIVGIFTGLYPARRAKKIPALNALRYE